MPERGMNRPEVTHNQPKSGKISADPIIAGTRSPAQKVYRTEPFVKEKPISKAYPVIDSDLARDNLENDLTAADIQDM
ncbi:MAG: hypothetical protein NC395_09695 [Prevotella sp.]|nr:hypothetical protein [Prevotella sp.]